MNNTTIVMLLASSFLLILGLILFISTKAKSNSNNENEEKCNNEYITINAMFNIGLGVVGIIIAILHHYLSYLDNQLAILFVVVIVITGIIQKIVSRKYLRRQC